MWTAQFPVLTFVANYDCLNTGSNTELSSTNMPRVVARTLTQKCKSQEAVLVVSGVSCLDLVLILFVFSNQQQLARNSLRRISLNPFIKNCLHTITIQY